MRATAVSLCDMFSHSAFVVLSISMVHSCRLVLSILLVHSCSLVLSLFAVRSCRLVLASPMTHSDLVGTRILSGFRSMNMVLTPHKGWVSSGGLDLPDDFVAALLAPSSFSFSLLTVRFAVECSCRSALNDMPLGGMLSRTKSLPWAFRLELLIAMWAGT